MKPNEMKPINNEWLAALHIEELEKRLETDPILLDGLFGTSEAGDFPQGDTPICEFTCLIY